MKNYVTRYELYYCCNKINFYSFRYLVAESTGDLLSMFLPTERSGMNLEVLVIDAATLPFSSAMKNIFHYKFGTMSTITCKLVQ